jgi:hypothetical protein
MARTAARGKMDMAALHAHHHGRMAELHKKLAAVHNEIADHHDEMETRMAEAAHGPGSLDSEHEDGEED